MQLPNSPELEDVISSLDILPVRVVVRRNFLLEDDGEVGGESSQELEDVILLIVIDFFSPKVDLLRNELLEDDGVTDFFVWFVKFESGSLGTRVSSTGLFSSGRAKKRNEIRPIYGLKN